MNFRTNTTEYCHWLHNVLEELPMIRYPFDTNILPVNGIYFFYQEGEFWGHGSNVPKIVRIGTHRDGNFRSRIKEHFLFEESKMNFEHMKRKPSDRSIFRKHVGRALLHREHDDYLKIWDKNFTKVQNQKKYDSSRDIKKEKDTESDITKILRQQFSFRFIIVDNQTERIGDKGLESSLIGTVSNCELCKPSNKWLGCFVPEKQIKIKNSGLWLIHHLCSKGIDDRYKETISNSINKTKEWIKNCMPRRRTTRWKVTFLNCSTLNNKQTPPDERNRFALLVQNGRAPFVEAMSTGNEREPLRGRVELFRLERQFNGSVNYFRTDVFICPQGQRHRTQIAQMTRMHTDTIDRKEIF